MKIKPFNLEEALAHPDRVVYRNGEKPLEWCYFKFIKSHWMIRSIGKFGELYSQGKDGKASSGDLDHDYDLLLICETKRVPLEPIDWIKDGPWWITIGGQPLLGITYLGVTRLTADGRGITYYGMMEDNFKRTNNGKDFFPCYKEETV